MVNTGLTTTTGNGGAERGRTVEQTEQIKAGRNALGQFIEGGAPPAHAWQPGQSGNPAGRVSAGASIREQLNTMIEFTAAELRVVAKDRKAPASRRAAAGQLLRMIRGCDAADFESYVDGSKTLVELRAAGVDTQVIKKMGRTNTTRTDKDGGETTTAKATLEFADPVGEALDRVIDRTEGRAIQRVAAQITDNRSGSDIATQLMEEAAKALPKPPPDIIDTQTAKPADDRPSDDQPDQPEPHPADPDAMPDADQPADHADPRP
jgi:hypothetical protein